MKRYAIAAIAVAAATAATGAMWQWTGHGISLFFFPAVVVSAMYGGYGPAAVATLLGLPYCSYAARIEPRDGRVQVRRLTARGHDVVEAPLPALVGCTQALGEPRYPTLRGIMSARQKPIRVLSLADLDLGGIPVGGAAATSRVTSVTTPPGRAAARVVRGSASDGAREAVAFSRSGRSSSGRR